MAKYKIVRSDGSVVETEYVWPSGAPARGEQITVTYTVSEVKEDGATVIITPVAGSLGPLPPGSKGSLG